MSFSTKECAWAQTSMKLLGRTVVGIRGFEFEKNVEKEYIHGAGDNPIDIQAGNKTYPASIKLLKYEVDAMNDAAVTAGYADITEIPHEAITITCMYRRNAADAPRTIIASGCAFTNLKVAMEQAAKMTEITLPMLVMQTVFK
jgi:hypothetical protein